ncbi:MAG: tetratricopeptide repeat protein [Spirochaetales bacterium]|nr:tetratricopeptide repeat protein [Spirochaetales bacterium]
MRKIPLIIVSFVLTSILTGQSKEQLFDQGLGAFQDRLYEDALVNFESYLDRYDSESRADAVLYMSGVALYSLGRYGESLESFARLERDKHDSPYLRRTPYWQGLNYYAQSEWAPAEEAFSEQLRFEGETYYVERSFLYLGLLQEKRADWAGAAESYARLVSLSGNTDLITQGYYRRGLAYLNLEEYERALPNFEKLSADYGSSPYTRAMPYYIGLCYLNLGQPEEAIRRFELYLTLFPSGEYKESVLFQLARAESEAGRREKALERLDELEEGSEGDVTLRARNMKAENYSSLGESEKARALWLELLEEETRPEEKDRIRYNLGLSWLKEGVAERAIPYFKETLALLDSPVRRDSLQALTSLYLEEGEKELALGYGKTLFDDYPDYEGREETGALTATLMMELNRRDMVEAHLKIMVDQYGRGEKNDLYLMMLGQAAMDREEWTGALRYLGRLESDYPQSDYREEALYRLGYIYILREEYVRGAEFLEKLLALDKELSPEVEEDSRYSLALAYYKGGRGSEALPLFEDYLNRYPEQDKAGEIALYIGNIHFDQRNWTDAADYYARAASSFGDEEQAQTALFKEALARQKKGEWSRAGDLFALLAQTAPAGTYGEESLYQEGICRLEEESFDDARLIFQEAADKSSGDVKERSLYQLARLALREGNREEAVRQARILKEDFPDSELGSHLFFSEAEDAWAQGEYEEARAWYLLCLEIFPDQSDGVQASLRASLALAETGRKQDAIEELFLGLTEGLAEGKGQELYGRASALGRLLKEGDRGEQSGIILSAVGESTEDLSLLAPLILAAERTKGNDQDRSELLESVYRSENLPFSLRTEALLLLGAYRIADGEGEEGEAFYRVVMDSNKGALGAEANYLLGELLAEEDRARGAQELLNLSYNYPEQDDWVARALYRSWELYAEMEGEEQKENVVKEKLLGLYPDSEEAAQLLNMLNE